MTDDLQLIKQLEEEIGIKLEKKKFGAVWANEKSFSVNKNRQVNGLNLDRVELKTLPPVLFQFRKLRVLCLSKSKIENLVGLAQFSGLTDLDLSGNQLTSLSGLEGLSGLTSLDLRGNKLTSLSILEGMSGLATLNVSGNQLTSLSGLEGLSGLTILDVSRNQLISLSGLEGMNGLKILDFCYNQIKEIPYSILQWKLDIDLNTQYWQISDKDSIYLHGNPIEEPPIEILEKGKKAILAYLKSLEQDKQLRLNEVKVLFVGDGGAGKTSLMKCLKGLDFDENESQTHGINIEKWSMENGDDEIKINLWDFGGQEIMHATHQFFLSKRSMYILVLDGRRDEKPEYWLKLVESFGGNSPVLVVTNKIDENPGFKLNQRFLQEKYPNITGFHRLSCKKNTGVPQFKQALEFAVKHVEIINITWPIRWFKVKEELENMTEPYITYDQYKGICRDAEVKEKNRQSTLVEFLNDLGVIVYFKDLDLKNLQVLEPHWLTGAVYKIINSEILAEQNGVLDLKDLETILDQKENETYCYPEECHIYIIRLMEKFELCYWLTRTKVLIPDLLDEEEPEFEFDKEEALKFIIQYDFLPRSVMPRFIVNRHKEIKNNLQWRTGVVLEDKEFKSTAAVKTDHEAKRIYIDVNGTQKRDYFAVILATLRKINQSFEKLKTQELIPMPDDPEITASYKQLIRLEKKGTPEYLPGESENEYKVKDLLGTITPEGPTIEDVYKILLKFVDENDTKESIARKVNGIISFKPSLLGIEIDGTKAADWLIQKVLPKKKKKKKN